MGCVASIVAALVIFVEDEDQTSWFASADLEAEVDFENVSLIKDEVSTVSASFKSGKNYIGSQNK